jgi:hypothetical protein
MGPAGNHVGSGKCGRARSRYTQDSRVVEKAIADV